jgi:protein-S-isoprenylcysteine O-methyltransferase Ste14
MAKTIASALVVGLLLFVSAGRLDWVMGWAYVGLSFIGIAASALVVDPELLAERAEIGRGVQALDVLLAIIMARLGPVAISVVAGLNLRFRWQPRISPGIQGMGAVAVLLGYVVTLWAMASNRFFSGVVRIQTERGHAVVTSGPYALVRHPGYAGVILATLGAPLMLRSAWALVPAAATVCVIVVRTVLEDRTLLRDLAGYRIYSERVRYRLLPGVW